MYSSVFFFSSRRRHTRCALVTGVQACALPIWSHAFMRHCPPRMVLGRGLREPDVSRIAGKLAALECAHDRIAIGQLAARGVDQIGTALEALERLVVDHVLGLRMERYVERDDVADAVHLLA